MAYLYSLTLRIADGAAAPFRVAICKSREVLVTSQNNQQNQQNQQDDYKIMESEKRQKNTENLDGNNRVPTINVDGVDCQTIVKKMERLNPSTGFIMSYLHYFSGPTEVYDRLYLGSAHNAASWYTLEDLGIKYIVNVTAEIDNFHEHSGITYYKIPIKDNNNESIKPHLEESFKKIDEFLSNKNGKVLVHCYMGASRSASVVADYIAKKTNADVTDVICNLIERRPIVNPTQQFVADLIKDKVNT